MFKAVLAMVETMTNTGAPSFRPKPCKVADSADGRQHEGRADHHNKGLGEVDCPQRVGPYTATDKNTVNDGEQEKGALAQNRGEDIFQDQLCSGFFHSGFPPCSGMESSTRFSSLFR